MCRGWHLHARRRHLRTCSDYPAGLRGVTPETGLRCMGFGKWLASLKARFGSARILGHRP